MQLLSLRPAPFAAAQQARAAPRRTTTTCYMSQGREEAPRREQRDDSKPGPPRQQREGWSGSRGGSKDGPGGGRGEGQPQREGWSGGSSSNRDAPSGGRREGQQERGGSSNRDALGGGRRDDRQQREGWSGGGGGSRDTPTDSRREGQPQRERWSGSSNRDAPSGGRRDGQQQREGWSAGGGGGSRDSPAEGRRDGQAPAQREGWSGGGSNQRDSPAGGRRDDRQQRDGWSGGGRGGGRNGPSGGWRDGQQRPRREAQVEEEIPVVRPGQANSATFFSTQRWPELGASEEVVAALAALGIVRPSHIQAAAFRALGPNSASTTAAGTPRHVVLADHAGSGKTLAYLLPLLQLLRQEEVLLGGVATQPYCPRLVVVVPTAELAAQVLRVCRALARTGTGLRFRSAAFTGGRPARTQRESLEGGVDVAVGTPGRLAELLAEGAMRMDFCRAVVCDEVDVLLGEDFSFAEQVRPLRAAAPASTRFVFATATIPEQVYLDLEESFPGLVAALGPGLHRTAPGITEQLVDCSGGTDVSEESGFQRKAAALFAVLQEQRASRAIVFCNKIETCRKVENFLNRSLSAEETVTVLPHHAAIADDRRDANLRRFLVAPANSSSSSRQRGGGSNYNNSNSGSDERQVLVCTDRASRGLDSAFVEHVVLFDLPRDPSEYLRRVGRTTRGAGTSGTVSVLALGRQVKLAKEIIDRNQGGLVLHRIPATLPVMGGGGGGGDRLGLDRMRSDMATAAAAQAAAGVAAAEEAAMLPNNEVVVEAGDEAATLAGGEVVEEAAEEAAVLAGDEVVAAAGVEQPAVAGNEMEAATPAE